LQTHTLSGSVEPEENDRPVLVLAHGFTQTGRLWGEFGSLLGVGRSLLGVDLPGHGGSAAVVADVPGSADLLVEAVPTAEPFDLLGYSLGARVALHAALAHPERIRRLVLIGATAGIEDPEAREARVARDEALAMELESSGDLEGFLRRWLAAPMFAAIARPDLAERLRNTPAGLASSLRSAGTATSEPVWDRLEQMSIPMLALAGATDARFSAAALRITASVPNGVCSLVSGAGHAAHLAQSELSAAIVGAFLEGDA